MRISNVRIGLIRKWFSPEILLISSKQSMAFKFLSKKTGIIDIDCVISWNDVFGEKHKQNFIFGYNASLSESIFGSKPLETVDLAGYQDTRHNN